MILKIGIYKQVELIVNQPCYKSSDLFIGGLAVDSKDLWVSCIMDRCKI